MRNGFHAFLVFVCLVGGSACSQEESAEIAIETRRYQLPWVYYQQLGAEPVAPPAEPADPFAVDLVEDPPAKASDLPIEKRLEFPEGTEVGYDRASATLTATGPPDVLESIETQLTANRAEERQIQIVIEVIDVATSDFSNWVYENRMSVDAGPLRETVVGWLKAGGATRLETLGGVARSGQRATFKGIQQMHVATESNPSTTPNVVDLEGDSEALLRPVHQTAWKVEELGAQLTVDPVLGADGRTIDLNLAPEIVEFVGTRMVPIDQPLTSVFEQRITTQVSTIDGNYTLLGSTHPRDRRDRAVLWFLRANVKSPPTWRRLFGEES